MHRKYRIGFLNPWGAGAEQQAVSSLAIAAERIGHELIRVRNSDEVSAANLDFLLAIEPGQPKLTDVPTFGAIHSPRAILLENRSHLENITYLQSILTYDGYLTIADTLERFLHGLCEGVGRPIDIGRYYNTPQRQPFMACRLRDLVTQGMLRLCYFGINWEPRARPLFRALAQRRYMRIYGPDEGWDYLNGIRYYGSVPFDGQSVQRIYAALGAGLVVLSTAHMFDDVISNRIFEITSVGAAAVCPDIPWIQKYYGNTVFYYDRFAPPIEIANQIDGIIEEIHRDPDATAERAAAARKVFEDQFAGEVMLQNAVAYFEKWINEEGKAREPSDGPNVDVIIRAEPYDESKVRRTISSIARQTVGCFRVIIACSREVELDKLTTMAGTRIAKVESHVGPDIDRALALALGAKRGEFIAVVEQGNFWLSNHISSLLPVVMAAPDGRACAYSGFLRAEEDQQPDGDEEGDSRERRHVGSLMPLGGEVSEILAGMRIDAFLIPAVSFELMNRSSWPAIGVPLSVLQANLLAVADPVFSYRATTCVANHQAATPSGSNPLDASEAEFNTMLRLHGLIERIDRNLANPIVPSWSRLHEAAQDLVEAQRGQLADSANMLALEGGSIVPPLEMRAGLEVRPIAVNTERLGLGGGSHVVQRAAGDTVAVLPPQLPWAYGVEIFLDAAALFEGPQWLILDFPPVAEVFSVGLVERAEKFLNRMQVPISRVPVQTWLYLPDPTQIRSLVVFNWLTPLSTEIIVERIVTAREPRGEKPFTKKEH